MDTNSLDGYQYPSLAGQFYVQNSSSPVDTRSFKTEQTRCNILKVRDSSAKRRREPLSVYILNLTAYSLTRTQMRLPKTAQHKNGY